MEDYITKNEPPDVWLLQETFLKGPVSPAISNNFYNIFQGPYSVLNEDRIGLLTLVNYRIKAIDRTPPAAAKYITAIEC